ncbi:MAG: hypothetical protein PHN57_04235 [Candidatus Omnitrophica bacterium]|nr:hypothetical protein [Candidatus Omnitrophota bacterium]
MKKLLLVSLITAFTLSLMAFASGYGYPIQGKAKLQEFSGKVEFFNGNYIAVSNYTGSGLKQIVAFLINPETVIYGEIKIGEPASVMYRVVRRARHQKHKNIAEQIYSEQNLNSTVADSGTGK